MRKKYNLTYTIECKTLPTMHILIFEKDVLIFL